MRIGLRRCFWLILVAGIGCMAVRSVLAGDAPGMLTWPVLLGFGSGRLASGTGVVGAAIGGVAASLIVLGSWTNPIPSSLTINGMIILFTLAAGACWGFYLGVWAYIIVETICQGI